MMSDHTIAPDDRSVSRIADQVEAFVRNIVVPYEKDPRFGASVALHALAWAGDARQ